MINEDQFVHDLVLSMQNGSQEAEEKLFLHLRKYALGVASNMSKSMGIKSFDIYDCDETILNCFNYFKKSVDLNRGPAIKYFRYIVCKKLYIFIVSETFNSTYGMVSLDSVILDDGEPLVDTTQKAQGIERLETTTF